MWCLTCIPTKVSNVWSAIIVATAGYKSEAMSQERGS